MSNDQDPIQSFTQQVRRTVVNTATIGIVVARHLADKRRVAELHKTRQAKLDAIDVATQLELERDTARLATDRLADREWLRHAPATEVESTIEIAEAWREFDPHIEATASEHLAEAKELRDQARAEEALGREAEAAQTGDPEVEPVVRDAVAENYSNDATAHFDAANAAVDGAVDEEMAATLERARAAQPQPAANAVKSAPKPAKAAQAVRGHQPSRGIGR